MSGTVISAKHHSTKGKSKSRRKYYSDIVIRYDGADGTPLTFSKDNVSGTLEEGESIPIRCSEDLKEAVIASDTRPDPVRIIGFLFFGLVFGYKGFPLLFQEIRSRAAASHSDAQQH